MVRLSKKQLSSVTAGSLLVIIIGFFFFLNEPERKPTPIETSSHPCVLGIIRENNLPRGPYPLIGVFYKFSDPFPAKVFEKYAKGKHLVVLTWEPYHKEDKKRSILPEIIAGQHDTIIKDFATSIKNYGDPIFLRFGHEMNGNWYPWAGIFNNKDPEIFKAAYRHIWNIFKEEKAYNVAFIFSPNFESFPNRKWNSFTRYYPGNDCVDVIGLDAYNFGNGISSLFSFWNETDELLEDAYKKIIKNYPQKPIFLTEVASSDIGGNKKLWIRNFFRELETHFRAIKAILWFDINKEQNWAIWHDSSLIKTYQESSKGPYFSRNKADLLWIFSKKAKSEKSGTNRGHSNSSR